MKRALIILGIVACSPCASASDPKVQEVLDCSAANGPEQTFKQDAHFSTFHPDGSARILDMHIVGARRENYLGLNLHVVGPASMAGTVILFKEKEGQDTTRVYLPSIKRAQNVTGSMAATRVLGTEFSYLDIKQLYGSFVEGASTYSKETEFLGRKAHEIVIVPKPEEASPYADLLTYIDAETCVVLGVLFRSDDQQILKRLEGYPEAITKTNQGHLINKYTMHNVFNSTRTEVTLGNVVFDSKIPNAVFHPHMFMGAAR